MKLIPILLLILSFPLLASPYPCANHAKSEAIKAYKSEVGLVQGAYGVDASVVFAGSYKNIVDYLVIIKCDKNENGGYLIVDYLVSVEKEGEECKIVKLEKQNYE